MQQSPVPGRAALGQKLHSVMPRMVLCPLSGLSGARASRAVRDRCRLFVDGEWARLWSAMPAPLPARARASLSAERDTRRGFAADPRLDGAVAGVEWARLSHACRLLTSEGVGDDALDFLRSVHYDAPAPDSVDPYSALSADEEAALDAAAAAPLPTGFLADVRAKLAELLPQLPKGVGCGVSGERYEHLRAAAAGDGGTEAVCTLGLQLVRGHWGPGMSAARLSALRKPGGTGFRPVASGEALRRVVGRAVLQVLAARLEHSAVSVNQLAFTKNGCLVAYSCLRHLLAANPGWVCWATDESNAFQRGSRPEMARQLVAEFPECVPYFLRSGAAAAPRATAGGSARADGGMSGDDAEPS
eukprot:SAG11_NODE_6700_length_1263_cov_2.264605_1_plen_358_part_10